MKRIGDDERTARDLAELGEWTKEQLIAAQYRQAASCDEWALKRQTPMLVHGERCGAAGHREVAALLERGADSDLQRGRAAYWAAHYRRYAGEYAGEALHATADSFPSRAVWLYWVAEYEMLAALLDAEADGAAPVYLDSDEELRARRAEKRRLVALAAKRGAAA